MEECEVRGVTDMTDSQEVKNVSEQQDALELNPLYPEYQAEHHSEYVDALKSAIGSDKKGKLRNIAISGTYGSGKSSILEKVVEDFEGVKPCSTKNISLAPLASCCGNAERRSDNNEIGMALRALQMIFDRHSDESDSAGDCEATVVRCRSERCPAL